MVIFITLFQPVSQSRQDFDPSMIQCNSMQESHYISNAERASNYIQSLMGQGGPVAGHLENCVASASQFFFCSKLLGFRNFLEFWPAN